MTTRAGMEFVLLVRLRAAGIAAMRYFFDASDGEEYGQSGRMVEEHCDEDCEDGTAFYYYTIG
jgi:hypothetical protein